MLKEKIAQYVPYVQVSNKNALLAPREAQLLIFGQA